MKLTIDTKQDSHDEIRRVINILTSVIGETGSTTVNSEVVDAAPPQQQENLFSMFNQPEVEHRAEPTAPVAEQELEEYTVESETIPHRDMPEVVSDDEQYKIIPY